jgi:hypothetical protein
MIMNRVGRRMTLALVAGGVLGGCASTAYNVAPLPPPTYEVLGKATGKTCGSLGVLASAYYFIPMGLNSRVEGAYQEALKSVPGATGLINVEMKEDWFWWLIGTARCVTISGDAIRGGA